MGNIRPTPKALLIVAIFSRYPAAIAWGKDACEAAWGPVALASEPFPFVETDYYEASMGPGIVKQFFAFEKPCAMDDLAPIKLQANAWEAELAAEGKYPEERPVNLDPGYITEAKLVLASTKDHAHRIYLRDGIYAEVTLYFKHQQWQARDWTFNDYRRPEYHAFFERCRNYFRQHREQFRG